MQSQVQAAVAETTHKAPFANQAYSQRRNLLPDQSANLAMRQRMKNLSNAKIPTSFCTQSPDMGTTAPHALSYC